MTADVLRKGHEGRRDTGAVSILPASVTHCASLVLLSASFLVRGNTIKRKGHWRAVVSTIKFLLAP